MLGFIDDNHFEQQTPSTPPNESIDDRQFVSRDFISSAHIECLRLKKNCVDRYTRGLLIGQGTYGKIYQAENKITKEPVTIAYYPADLDTPLLRQIISGHKLRDCPFIYK